MIWGSESSTGTLPDLRPVNTVRRTVSLTQCAAIVARRQVVLRGLGPAKMRVIPVLTKGIAGQASPGLTEVSISLLTLVMGRKPASGTLFLPRWSGYGLESYPWHPVTTAAPTSRSNSVTFTSAETSLPRLSSHSRDFSRFAAAARQLPTL